MIELEVTRKIDELGRVVLPQEMRNALKMDSGSSVKVVCEDDRITLIPVKK